MKDTLNVGIIGCGNISDIYLTNLSKRFDSVQLVACADMIAQRAKEKAEKYGIEERSVDTLLGSADIDIIINLTIPLAHAEVAMKALNTGKHVYTEKPLAATRAEGMKIMELAAKKNLRVGGAPDTFLGAGIQTCRDLIKAGAIGDIVGGTANMLCPGHESWHPDPAFYYKKGGGPVLDMGPYYLTALVELIGPLSGVSASVRSAFAERVVGSGPKKGQKITVEVPTHAAGLLRFDSGALVALSMSFDVQGHRLPPIELWGTQGSLAVPDPNTFGGPVLLRKKGENEWSDVAIQAKWADNSRGLGVADMATGILENRPTRASGALCFHVLDAMEGIHDAGAAKAERDLSVSARALKADMAAK
jgi:predicted dehydrogenase